MSRRSRLALVLLPFVLAGVVVASAAAIAFTDDSFNFPQGVVDASYSHTVQIRPGGGTAPYTYTVINGALPPGLSLGLTTGAVTGKPTTAGTYTFDINGADACPEAVQCIDGSASPPCTPEPEIDGTCRFRQEKTQRSFSIIVVPRVLITDQVPPPGTTGSPYSLTLVAVMKSGPGVTSDPSSPLTWTILSGQLPPGLAMSAGGVISGTPTTAGQFTFTLQAALVDGRSDTKTQTITVRDALKVTGTGISGARSEVGVPYQASLTATGGSGTFTWSLGGGSLPRGVTLAQDGSISGTPRESGRFAFQAKVTDSESRSTSVNGVLVVAPRLLVPKQQLRLGKAGRLYRARLVATGGVIPKLWKVTNGPLPRGLRLDRKTGIISGTPRKAGRYPITVQITDGFQVVSTRTLRITVLP